MYKYKICLKYLLSRRFVSLAAVLAIGFSVGLLIVVMSIMEGFKETMRERIRGTLAHLSILQPPVALAHWEEISAAVEGLDHVVATAPFVRTIAVFRISTLTGNHVEWSFLRGVDPLREARVGKFAEYLLRPGELEEFVEQFLDPEVGRKKARVHREREGPLSEAEIRALFSLRWRREIFDRHLQARLGGGFEGFADAPPQPIVVGVEAIRSAFFRLGEIVTLTTFSPASGDARKAQFMVVGAFKTGLYERDQRTIYTSLAAACEFVESYDPDLRDADGDPVGGYRTSGISIALEDYRHAEEVKERTAALLGSRPAFLAGNFRSPEVKTWEEQKVNLLRAVDVEKGIISLILIILVAFSAAIIFLILTVQLIEKTRDLGILQAIGARPAGILAIFLMTGLVIAAVGLGLGTCGGVTFARHINALHDWISSWTGWELFPRQIYYLDRIPVYLNLSDLFFYLVLTVLLGFLGSLIPAAWAARRDPIKAIRYE